MISLKMKGNEKISLEKIPKMTHEKKKINYNVVEKKNLYIPF